MFALFMFADGSVMYELAVALMDGFADIAIAGAFVVSLVDVMVGLVLAP
jgi:hypothetical protein